MSPGRYRKCSSMPTATPSNSDTIAKDPKGRRRPPRTPKGRQVDPRALDEVRALLGDRHDLINKAAGWMLREVGKRVDLALLRTFLDEHAARMPRTMLSYATEQLTAGERAGYRSMR